MLVFLHFQSFTLKYVDQLTQMFHFLSSFSSSVCINIFPFWIITLSTETLLSGRSFPETGLSFAPLDSGPQHHTLGRGDSVQTSPHSAQWAAAGLLSCRLTLTPSHGSTPWSKWASLVLPCQASCGEVRQRRRQRTQVVRGAHGCQNKFCSFSSNSKGFFCPSCGASPRPCISRLLLLPAPRLPSFSSSVQNVPVISSHSLCPCWVSDIFPHSSPPLDICPSFKASLKCHLLPNLPGASSSCQIVSLSSGFPNDWRCCSKGDRIGSGKTVICASLCIPHWVRSSPGQTQALFIFVCWCLLHF